MNSTDLLTLAERVVQGGLYGVLANSHPSLSRGIVWCTACGKSRLIDPASALRYGWPKHCGYTMTIDSPEERAALRARAADEGGEG